VSFRFCAFTKMRLQERRFGVYHRSSCPGEQGTERDFAARIRAIKEGEFHREIPLCPLFPSSPVPHFHGGPRFPVIRSPLQLFTTIRDLILSNDGVENPMNRESSLRVLGNRIAAAFVACSRQISGGRRLSLLLVGDCIRVR